MALVVNGGCFLDSGKTPREEIARAVEHAAYRLANALGILWDDVPCGPTEIATSETGLPDKDAFRQAVTAIYRDAVGGGQALEACRLTASALAEAIDAGTLGLEPCHDNDNVAAAFDFFAPGGLDGDKGLRSGTVLATHLPISVSPARMAHASWAGYDMLMSGLGAALPANYLLFMLKRDIGCADQPTKAELADLRASSAQIIVTGEEIEMAMAMTDAATTPPRPACPCPQPQA